MAPPKDIARSYPKRGLTADVGFRSEPKFCGDGSIQLDGSNQYLNAELSSALGDSFTVMGWAKREGASATLDYIMNAGNPSGAGNAISISITNVNPGVLYFFDNSTSVNTSNTVEFNEWFHFALTVAPGAGNVKLYKNGIDGTPSNSVAVNLSDVTFELGRYLLNNHYFQGKLFDVRVYDETLTQDQIRELLNNPGQTVPTGLTSADLIHRYLLETDTNDSGATGNNLTANNSPTFGVDRAQLPRGLDLTQNSSMARVYTGRAVDFDGSTDFLDMGLGADKNYTTRSDRASFSVWFNVDTTSVVGFIYQNRHNNVGGTDRPECETQLFTHPSLGLAFDGEGASVLIPLSNIKVGVWHHFVGVADDSDGPVKAYLDGVLYDTTSGPQAGANGNNFVIGARNNSPIQVFNGQLSNFKIFNVELTQAQVRELYHNPEMVIPTGVSASNLRRHYPLCAYNDTGGMGGRHEIDQGVEGVSGEYGGSPIMDFAQPVPCPQLALQQSASRISMQDTTNNTYYVSDVMSGTPFTNQGTLSGWFIMNELPGTGGSDYNPIFILGKYQADKDLLEIAYDNNSTHGSPNIWLTNGGGSIGVRYNHTFELGKLQHVVVTTLATSPYWQLWINGEKKTVSARAFSSSRTAWDFGDNKLSGGRWGDGPYGGVCHFIPVDTAVWNTVLSDPEVAQVYNSGVPGDVSEIASANLQAWWKCDDLTNFKDYSGNGVSGTVTTGSVAPELASFPENASGSTLVGDISMKRKGASVLNCFNDPATEGVRTEIPEGAGLAPSLTDGHAVSVWYRNQKQDTTSANNGTMITFGSASGTDRFIIEALNGNSFRGIYGNVTANSTATISDNDWHHYAMVLDVTTSPNPTVRVYLDGVAAGTATGALGTTFPDALTTIGWMTTGKASFNYGLKGPLACPRIYAFQLSENEIKQIYHADERLIKGLNNE